MAEQPVVPDEPTPAEEHQDSSDYVIPRGAIAFSILMILGYIFYFFMIWSEVVLTRGGS